MRFLAGARDSESGTSKSCVQGSGADVDEGNDNNEMGREAQGLVTKYRNAGNEGDKFDTPGTIYIIITISFVVVRQATLCALKSCAEYIGALSSWLSKALMLFVGSFRAIGLTSAFG